LGTTIDVDCASEGCLVNCNGLVSCLSSIFEITNSNGLDCIGGSSCASASITFINNIGGQLNCIGASSCFFLTISLLENINSIICTDSNACSAVDLVATPFNDSFSIDCSGDLSCFESIFNITITNAFINNIIGLNCDGTGSCASSTFIFDASNLDNSVTINSIRCDGNGSCRFTNIKLINAIINESDITFIGDDASQGFNITCFDSSNQAIDTSLCVL